MPKKSTAHAKPPKVCRAFGQAVRARRNELGLTQEDLAAAAQINRTYIGDIERGARNVALTNIVRLAHALKLTVPEFFARYPIDR